MKTLDIGESKRTSPKIAPNNIVFLADFQRGKKKKKTFAARFKQRDKFDKFYNKRVFHLFRDVTLFQSYISPLFYFSRYRQKIRKVRSFFFCQDPAFNWTFQSLERNILIGNTAGKIGGCTPMGRKDGL